MEQLSSCLPFAIIILACASLIKYPQKLTLWLKSGCVNINLYLIFRACFPDQISVLLLCRFLMSTCKTVFEKILGRNIIVSHIIKEVNSQINNKSRFSISVSGNEIISVTPKGQVIIRIFQDSHDVVHCNCFMFPDRIYLVQ